MRSYAFIEDLNKNVFAKSKAIQGRFYFCPRMGTEINTDDLEQVIKDLVIPATGKKYPLALMMPPVAYGKFTDRNGEWVNYHFILFLLKTTYYSSTNQIQSPNINTNTSTHTVPQDWHDMFRVAVNYIRVLSTIQRSQNTINTSFRLDQSFDRIIRPISFIGADRVSGVRLDYRASVLIGCEPELEDYDEADISGIVIPAEDSHPEHQL